MEDVEIYVLFEKINKKYIDLFSEFYLQGYQEYSTNYQYGGIIDGKKIDFVTESYQEILNFMLEGGKGLYSFYLSPSESDNDVEIIQGIIFFNEDNTLMLGLRVPLNLEQKYINSIKNNFHTEDIFCCYDEFPPTTKKEFLLKKANA